MENNAEDICSSYFNPALFNNLRDTFLVTNFRSFCYIVAAGSNGRLAKAIKTFLKILFLFSNYCTTVLLILNLFCIAGLGLIDLLINQPYGTCVLHNIPPLSEKNGKLYI